MDSRAPAGTLIESPYTSRVRMIVVRADARPGAWRQEERHVTADFRLAFGDEHGPGVPRLQAVALAALRRSEAEFEQMLVGGGAIGKDALAGCLGAETELLAARLGGGENGEAVKPAQVPLAMATLRVLSLATAVKAVSSTMVP